MYCNRRLFWLTAAVHGLNWLCYLLSIFWVEMHRWMMVFFLLMFIYVIVMDCLMKRDGKFREPSFWGKEEWKFTGWRAGLVGVSACVTMLMFAIGVGILAEGQGTIVDDIYWIENHGDYVRQITWEEYSKLIRAEASMVYGFFLFPTANPLAYYAEEQSQFREKIKA